jgi:general secretion pathway protein D
MRTVIVHLIFLVPFLGCGPSKGAFEQGNEEAKRGRWDEAVSYYERAAGEDPENVEYRIELLRALLEASRFHLKEARKHLAAEDLESAVQALEMSAGYDPSNEFVREELELVRLRLEDRDAMRSVACRPGIETQAVLDPASPVPIHLQFAEGTSLRKVFEALSNLAGVNILFDESFRDKPVTIDLEGVTFQEALDILVQTNGLFYKVLRPTTVIISPDIEGEC